MKRLPILIPTLLFVTLACSLFSTGTPSPTQTVSPPIAVSPTFPSDEPSTPPSLAEDVTSQPPALVPTFPAPQPAVKHYHSGDAIVLDRITMIDARKGWAISGADVLFTGDGAKTWREATPPEVLPSGSQVHAQGGFPDAQHAWIVFSVDSQIPTNAVVWSTSDFGYTWVPSAPLEHQAFGEQVWAEGFALDGTYLWLMVRGVYVGAGTHYDAQLLRSASAGHIWQPLAGNESFDYNYDYTGLVFADPDDGLVTWQTTGAYAPGPPEYAVTSDGAANWTVGQLPPPSDTPNLFETFDYCEPFQPQMLSTSSIRLLVGCFDAYDPPHAFSSYLYSSEDGGSTWTSVHLPEKVLASQVMLFFFDRDNALLLGRDIYRSVDGGQRWDFVKSVTWDGQFSFVDPQTGWAIARSNGQTALVKTSNGGAAWIELKPVIAP
ncbi:MAG TPA: hypothetical protein VLE49_11840 [Anaerolineales bacterium]|nr:hypothetical protein [Anaerolineales bacterium]